MNTKKASAVFSALVITVTTNLPFNNVYAENSAIYEDFNENDVNGTVTVKIPENTTADIKITFTSPEVTDEPYYSAVLSGGQIQSFAIEGRDNTPDDYRNYKLNVAVTDSTYNSTITYADTFTVPDVNDNPDSFKKIDYTFSIGDNYSGKQWEISSETETQKNITLYFSDYTLGDVNSDGIVDAVDASIILDEYALLSTVEKGNFTENQKLSANVNKDSVIDAVDASMVLNYYAEISTNGNPSWDIPSDSTTTTTTTTTTTNTNTSSTTTTAITTTNNKPSTVDYSSYKESIQILSSQIDTVKFHNYYVYDINNDGVYELITEMGKTDEDNKYSVYTMKNNEMTFIEDIDAVNSSLVEKNENLYKDYTADTKQTVEQIIFDGEKITTKSIYENTSGIHQDYGKAIKSYDWSDLSGIPTKSVTITSTKPITTTTTTTSTKPVTTTTTTTSTKPITTNTTKTSTKPITTTTTTTSSKPSTTNTTSTTSTTTLTTIPQEKLDSAIKNAVPANFSDPEYNLSDINNDNIPELFISGISEAGLMVGIHTYVNGEFVNANIIGENSYINFENSLIKVTSREGAIATFFYKLSDNNELTLVDKFIIYIGEYYYNNTLITEEDYNNKIAKYNSMSWIEPTYKKVPLYKGFPNFENAPDDMIFYSTALIGTVVTDYGNLNMRTGAGTNYSIIQTIPSNSTVHILGKGNNWYYISYQNNYGYVSADYISLTGKPTNPYENYPNIENAPSEMIFYSEPVKGVVKTDSEGLNMRTGAEINYTIMQTLPPETEVKVLGSGNNWYYIEYNNTYGFVSSDFVSLIYVSYEGYPNFENAPDDMSFYSSALKGTVTTDSEGLNMRTGAGTYYNIIQVIPQNAQITVLGSNANWYYIEYNNNYGYVSTDFVTLVS